MGRLTNTRGMSTHNTSHPNLYSAPLIMGVIDRMSLTPKFLVYVPERDTTAVVPPTYFYKSDQLKGLTLYHSGFVLPECINNEWNTKGYYAVRMPDSWSMMLINLAGDKFVVGIKGFCDLARRGEVFNAQPLDHIGGMFCGIGSIVSGIQILNNKAYIPITLADQNEYNMLLGVQVMRHQLMGFPIIDYSIPKFGHFSIKIKDGAFAGKPLLVLPSFANTFNSGFISYNGAPKTLVFPAEGTVIDDALRLGSACQNVIVHSAAYFNSSIGYDCLNILVRGVNLDVGLSRLNDGYDNLIVYGEINPLYKQGIRNRVSVASISDKSLLTVTNAIVKDTDDLNLGRFNRTPTVYPAKDAQFPLSANITQADFDAFWAKIVEEIMSGGAMP